MAKREKQLFLIEFSGGTTHKSWKRFYLNAKEHNPQSGGHGGFDTAGVVAGYFSADELKMLLIDGIKDSDLVLVTPITKASLAGEHKHLSSITQFFKDVVPK